MDRPPQRTAAALFVAVLALSAGCIGPGSSCDELPAEIDTTLRADGMTPSNLEVCRGDEVTLVVTPEVDGILHVHGYDDELPAMTVRAGEELDVSFAASRSGQFPIELHTDEDPAGVNVGLLTVHEP